MVWFGLWCLMPLSTIFQLSWQSVFLVEETRVPRENHRQALSHNVLSNTPHLIEIQTHNVSGEGTYCIGSCKSNYHMMTTVTVPKSIMSHTNSLTSISCDNIVKQSSSIPWLYRILWFIPCCSSTSPSR